MENIEFIDVLWVENDPIVLEEYPREAELYGINLVPFPCWDDAEIALHNDFNRWAAIILDAKCKVKRNDVDNSIRFLSNVIANLEKLYHEYQHHINWYILSAGGAEVGDLNNLIHDSREQWDIGWEKKYYSKNQDRQILYKRIKDQFALSSSISIRNILYTPVFRAISECKMDDRLNVCMEDLLRPIHYAEISDKDYNNRFSIARKAIEYIFRSMMDNGFIPPSFRNAEGSKDQLNLSNISMFLSGRMKSNDYNIKPILPLVLQEHVKNIIYNIGAGLHTSKKNIESDRNITEYLLQVDESPYLLRSITFQLCDLILWYKNYLKQHPDPGANILNWYKLPQNN